jgi:hypothetical protein
LIRLITQEDFIVYFVWFNIAYYIFSFSHCLSWKRMKSK